MLEENLKNKTAKGLFWGGISNGSQQILQAIFGLFMLRILDPEDWGIVGMLGIFTAIALSLQDSGFTIALINNKNIRNKDYNAVFWFNVITSLTLYICLFFAAPLIADYFERPVLISVSRVLFLSFLIGGIGIAQHAYIVKNLMVKEKAKIDIIALFFSGITGIFLALKGYAYWAIVIQNVTYFTIATIIRWYYVPWKPSLNINFQPLKSMFSFSIKILFTSIFSKITENIFSVILGKNFDAKMVGYYTQGNKWSTMGGAFICGMIGNIAMPILAQIGDDKKRQKNAFRKMIRFGAFVSFPLLLGLAFVGKEFLTIVGNGDKWHPATPFLQLFCIWNSFLFLYFLYTSLLLTHKKSDIYMKGTIITSISQLAISLFMFKYGIFQMLIAYIGIYFISFLYWHYHTRKFIELNFFYVIKDIMPYFITTIACILTTWFITKNIDNLYVRFISKISITAVLYLLIMWKSNSIIMQESFSFIKGKIKH